MPSSHLSISFLPLLRPSHTRHTHPIFYRLQASEGFWKAGGFRGVYKGLGAAAAGSAPGAALFFSIYESLKQKAEPHVAKEYAPLVHMAAASIGETGACLIRVPTENVKQNLQAGRYQTQGEAVRTIMGKEGVMGFYKGFLSTVFREVSRGREGGSEGGKEEAIIETSVLLFLACHHSTLLLYPHH